MQATCLVALAEQLRVLRQVRHDNIVLFYGLPRQHRHVRVLVLFAGGGAKAAVLSETLACTSFKAGMVVSRDRGGKSLVAAQVSGPAQIIQQTMWHTVLSADQ